MTLGVAYPSHASKDRSPKVRTAALRAVLAIRWLRLYANHQVTVAALSVRSQLCDLEGVLLRLSAVSRISMH